MRLPRLALAALAIIAVAGDAAAQGPADGPFHLAGGRVVVSGEVTATVSTASAADEGWFNYSSYELSTLRNIRVALAADARLSRRVSVVGEVRTDRFEHVEAYALFLRVRPWLTREIDLHVGRIPPTFGAFSRRLYNADNPVVGMPLAYQYLTSLHTDAVPGTADDLANMRGRGWESNFPIGNPQPDAGLPLVNALRWDTGAQVRAGFGPVVALGSVTTGTLSNPRVVDDNGGPQLAGRLEYTPRAALTVGASAATGPYLSDQLTPALPAAERGRRFRQRAVGADVEASHGRWIVRAEALRSSWELPVLGVPAVPGSVSAWSAFVEGRYRVAPGWDLGSRIERLSFDRIATSRGTTGWDAPVDRVEIALGWAPRRRLRLKAAWQINARDAGQVRSSRIGALQCIAWF